MPTTHTIRNADAALLATWPLPPLGDSVDKNDRGSVLIIAGSLELSGTAVLAAQSTLRAGAGKVTLITSATASPLIATILPEARVIGLPDGDDGGLIISPALMDLHGKQFDALLAGPGMQNSFTSRALIEHVLTLIECKSIILDATALDAATNLAHGDYQLLLTPHMGEMAHLSKRSKEEVLENPLSISRLTAANIGGLVMLKGAETYISNAEGTSYIHTGGHVGLAISGSGDCLAGIVAGLAARGASLEQAAVWGAFVHGAVGALLAERYGGIGFLPSEIPPEIPRIINSFAGS
jgi:hydroxyethylthiazole kinase-like uncharacterized protein yjeF